ncbi:MAG: pyruvate kinase [Lachnospiraceae bacterium]
MLKRTKIICTMGPACENEKALTAMINNGMNVARFNFSHGDHEEQMGRFKLVDGIRKSMNAQVAALLDTKGPEIRLGVFANGKEILEDGAKFTLTTEDIEGTVERATLTYKNLKNDVKPGSTILFNDGAIELVVDDITGEDINCTIVNGGPISNKKGINVPDADLSMPYLSESDKRDIIFGCETGFDFIAASFVRNAGDVKDIRDLIEAHNGKMQIIAKIENRQGIDNLDEILELADGIMVARGDMGVEIPFEQVPRIQKDMILKAKKAGKIVVTATQMLESMTNNPRPTRAEVADVANAVYDGTTAIMLSGETAAGKYPAGAVLAMAKIAAEAEKHIDYAELLACKDFHNTVDSAAAISYAACTIATEIDAAAIIAVTMSGSTVNTVSNFKPPVQIIGCSVSTDTCYHMAPMWGVQALQIEMKATEDELFAEAIAASKAAGLVKAGDKVVVVAGVPLGKAGTTNMVKVLEVA